MGFGCENCLYEYKEFEEQTVLREKSILVTIYLVLKNIVDVCDIFVIRQNLTKTELQAQAYVLLGKTIIVR